MTETAIIEIMVSKARQTIAAEVRYKRYIKRSHFIVAVGISKKGNMLSCSVSKPAQRPKHLPSHAEGAIMLKCGKRVDTIYIAKFTRDLKFAEIRPCAMCDAYARKHKIKIITMEGNMSQTKTKVLIICGGGVFGCIPAYFLGQVPACRDGLNKIDALAGCSIGGILACMYAVGNSFSTIKEYFPQLARNCFKKRPIAYINPIACPTYEIDGLRTTIKQFIPEHMKLRDVRQIYPYLDLIVPTLNLTDNKYKVYDNIVEDADLNEYLLDIAIQTAAAPSYFPGIDSKGKCIVDGGLIEVAPLLTAVTALKSKRNVPFKDMDVLMIGVGTEVDREKLTSEKYNSLSLLGLATKVIVPYTTEANELATVFWGNNMGFNSFRYFNPCRIKGDLDDPSRIKESLEEAEKYKNLFVKIYEEWLCS